MVAQRARLVFDADAFELRADDAPVDLEPQALDVLVHLLEHRGELVTKEQLLDEVWGDRFVSESALTTRIKQIRHALGDDGRSQRMIKTVHGRGYRFVGELAVTRSASPAPMAPGPKPGELPTDRTALIGRTDDIETVARLLDESRLVTLLGIGGTGKTRLATAVARSLDADFDDGVVFVDLVPTTGDDVFAAIARAAGLGLGADEAAERICALLSPRDVLIVLDNCEHVIDQAADAVDRIISSTAAPRVLVTSREPLDLLDERRFVVQPLPVGRDGGDALDLLAATSARFGVRFGSDGERADAIRICRGLDGLPLAVELAGAQLRHLTVAELADRLDRRFELLVGPRRERRHASLLAVLDDSWDALEEQHRQVLGQLAVFPGPFSLDDAEGVIGDNAAGDLGALTDRSLVDRTGGADFRLLESVRLLALRRASAETTTERRDRHAAWCLDSVGTDLHGHYFDLVLARWIRAHENDLNAAERHLVSSARYSEAAELVASAGLSLHIDDGRRAADALPRVDAHLTRVESEELRARLHATGALAAMAARAPELIAHHGREAAGSARRLGDPSLLGLALVLESWSAVFERPEHALELVDEAVELGTAAGDPDIRDLAEGYRAWHLAVLRRDDEARATARRVVDRGRLEGYPGFSALMALAALCAIHDPEATRELTASWPDQLTYTSMWGNELVEACVHAASGELAEAVDALADLDRRLTRAGQSALPDLLIPAALLADILGEHERAERWLAAVRHSSRPTQSFQATVLYRQVRSRVGPGDDVVGARDLDAVGQEALTWLAEATVAV